MAGGLSSLSDELDKLMSFIDCIAIFGKYGEQKRFSGVVYTVMEPAAHSTLDRNAKFDMTSFICIILASNVVIRIFYIEDDRSADMHIYFMIFFILTDLKFLKIFLAEKL